ncbi:hypothetical protein JCM11491_006379 [Sporobolomyces phaffii]
MPAPPGTIETTRCGRPATTGPIDLDHHAVEKLHQRTAPLPEPSQAYLSAAAIPSSRPESTPTAPPILILDLNHTLLCRSERNRAGSKVPLVRPYLSCFLEYVCSPVTDGASDARFVPIVFSSARYRNVLSLLVALDLVSPHRLPPPLPPRNRHGPPPPRSFVDQPTTYTCEESKGDVLKLVWTRENMGLNARDFGGDVETVKDLEGVWKALQLGRSSDVDNHSDLEMEREEEARNMEGARRTILLDDEVSKAAQQPYSLLPIKPFLLTPQDFPPLPLFQPKSADDVPPPPSAVELPTRDHPAWSDRTLLSITYQLDRMSRWDNISHEVRDGGIERIRREVRDELERRNGVERNEVEIDDEMERRGEKLIKAAGIEVRKEWDRGWRDRVLGKSRRGHGRE